MSSLQKDDRQILHDIASGRYRDSYLIYNRKSTDDADNQKNSIQYQKAENTRFAYREGLPIAPVTLGGFATSGIVSERHSGFKEAGGLTFGEGNTVQYRVDRPKFHQLVQLLSKGCFKGVIILCWDRASRNKGDDTILRKLIKAGVDIRFALAQYERTSAGELHMDIDGMFAEHHSRVTREKVTLNIRNMRARGVCTHAAGVGYLNEGTMEHKPFDPVRAPILRQAFEKAATGEWSLSDLARWANDQGFTMGPRRRRRTKDEFLAEEEDDAPTAIERVARPLTPNVLHAILTNRFYTGRIRGNDGTWIPSVSHQALVSDDLFNQVQVQLSRRNRSVKYAAVIDYPLRGMARCALCRRLYTPYLKKGILYYGTRCDGKCPNPLKNFNFTFLTAKVAALIRQLAFTDDELVEIDARSETDLAVREIERTRELESIERRKKKLREDLAYLAQNRLPLLTSGAYSPEALVAEEAKLGLELSSLRESEGISDEAMRATVKDVVAVSELLKNVAVLYEKSKPRLQEEIIRTIFSELSIAENTFDYQCTRGFRPLASRFVTNSALTTWLSELVWYRDEILEAKQELEHVLTQS